MLVLSSNVRVEGRFFIWSSLVLVAASASLLLLLKRKPSANQSKKKSKKQNYGVLPGGLVNVGHSCYLNSTVQLMAAAADVIEPLFMQKQSRIGQELVKLITRINSGDTLRPVEFIRSFASTASFSTDQQDAHEFLLALLNLSDTETSKKTLLSLGLNVLGLANHKFISSDQCEEPHLTFSTQNPFAGALLSEFVCMRCAVRKKQRNVSSIRLEPFSCLSLISSDQKTLSEAVYEHLCVPERLSDYLNENCGERGSVRQKRPVLLPELLLLHLPQLTGLSGWKDTASVPRLEDNELSGPGYRYRLLALIVHLGSHGASGHFVCYRRLLDDRWLFCNDAKIQVVPSTTIFAQTPYILLYQKEP